MSYAEVFIMLDLISVPVIDLLQPDQAEELRERQNGWDFVLTEAHHRMKNTLALAGGVAPSRFHAGGLSGPSQGD